MLTTKRNGTDGTLHTHSSRSRRFYGTSFSRYWKATWRRMRNAPHLLLRARDHRSFRQRGIRNCAQVSTTWRRVHCDPKTLRYIILTRFVECMLMCSATGPATPCCAGEECERRPCVDNKLLMTSLPSCYIDFFTPRRPSSHVHHANDSRRRRRRLQE